MCLGIPGRIEAIDDDNPHLATVSVAGVERRINVGLLEDDGIAVGHWVLIHVGFAMAIIDEQEAATALEGLQLLGGGFDDEMDQFLRSAIE